MADDDRLRGELYSTFKDRALMYWHVFAELRRTLGEPQATGLLSSAIEARGREIRQPGGDACCHLHIRPGRAH